MRRNVRLFIALTIGPLGVLAAAATPARAFDPFETAHGVVEAAPGHGAATAGVWNIGGRAVRVDHTTRIETPSELASGGYWVQTRTGVVVRAPGWTPEQAQAAGFRAASLDEAAARIAVGRMVLAKLRPGYEEPLLASEIHILPHGARGDRVSTTRVGRPARAE